MDLFPYSGSKIPFSKKKKIYIYIYIYMFTVSHYLHHSSEDLKEITAKIIT